MSKNTSGVLTPYSFTGSTLEIWSKQDLRSTLLRAAFYEGNRTIRTGPSKLVEASQGKVQIKVSHCGICGTDLHLFHGEMDHRVQIPQVIGHEMSGTITAIGRGVNGFGVGDQVTVMPLDPCNQCPACRAGHSHICQNLKFLGIDAPGALQSYWTVPAHTLHRLPPSLALAHGAMIEPLAVACHDVRQGEVKPGDYVVVFGSGPIGTLVALVARSQGARVLVSEINPFRLKLAQDLGFEVVNPLEQDVLAAVTHQTEGAGADVVFEVTGSSMGAELMTQLPRTRGRIVIVGIFSQPPKVDLFRFFWRELQLCGARVYEHQDFEKAIQMAAAGSIPLSHLITETYGLDQVESAIRQLEGGGAVMKILIKCSEDE
jgi:2-desacetyl-2-hydroxyethyl bacteriochlorophyllide A dehydrogenase